MEILNFVFLNTIVLAVGGPVNGICLSIPQSYDTIVVGLGSSGVTAATTLARAGKRVLGLEAMDRIGGRVKTVPFGDGIAEEGAEWIHGTENSRVYELAIQNNITILPQDLDFVIYRSDGDESQNPIVYDLIKFCMEKSLDSPDTSYNSIGDYLSAEIVAYIKRKYPQLEGNKQFIDEFLELINIFVNAYEASNDWHEVTTKSKSQELKGHQHMSWHKYGYKTFFELMLNTYNNGPGLPNLDIKLSTEVSRIVWPQQGSGDVRVTCVDGSTYTARDVIVTVSLGVLKERHSTLFSPGLPQDKITSIDKISFGVVDKLIFFWSEPWWDKKYFTMLWSQNDISMLADDDKWMGKVADVSPGMASNKTLTFWMTGDAAKHNTVFSPELPQDKITSIEKLSMGLLDKIILNFPQKWWEDDKIYVLIEAEQNSDDLWFSKHGDLTVPMAFNTTLTFWLAGDVARMVETLPDDVVQRKSMELLRRFLGKNYTIPEPTGMIRSKWYSNPYVRGSYTYDNLETPLYPNAREILGSPLLDATGVPRVLFAGEATNPVHYSTVHGASETGYREAMRLLET